MADQTTYEDLTKILDTSKVPYVPHPETSSVEFALTGEKRVYQFICLLRAERESLSILVAGLLFSNNGFRDATCTLLMEVNYRTWLGHFERDANDGEVRFRIELPLWRTRLESWEFLRCVVAAGNAVDENIELIDQVSSGTLPLDDALKTLRERGVQK